MDIQKERKAFESAMHELSGGKTKNDVNPVTREYQYGVMQVMWQVWQAAKAQAVPEGFVLVPKLLSDELADELAGDAFNNIQSMFDYEHRGSTATHREQIRLRWCRNKAREFQENYKLVIEAQEQKG